MDFILFLGYSDVEVVRGKKPRQRNTSTIGQGARISLAAPSDAHFQYQKGSRAPVSGCVETLFLLRLSIARAEVALSPLAVTNVLRGALRFCSFASCGESTNLFQPPLPLPTYVPSFFNVINMESLHGSSSALRADAPVFTPTSPKGENGARRRASAVGGRSFTATSRGGRGGGRGGGRSHPLPRGSTFSGNRRSSMSSVSDGQRGFIGGTETQVLKERAVENGSTGTAAVSDTVDPTKPFHSKMSSTEAYKLRQAKASAAYVKKQRAAKLLEAAAAAATVVDVSNAGPDIDALHADAKAPKADTDMSADVLREKNMTDGKFPTASSTSHGESATVGQSPYERTEACAPEELEAANVPPNRDAAPPVSPLQHLATPCGHDSSHSASLRTDGSNTSSLPAAPHSSASDEPRDLSPSALSFLSGAGSLPESPEHSRLKSSDQTRRRLEPVTPAAIAASTTQPAPCELDESGKCVHALAAAAANAAATAAANAAAAAAAAAGSTPSPSTPASSAGVDLESGKWCVQCAGLGLHIAALVAELKAGKVVDRGATEADRASARDEEERRERDRAKPSWKRTVSNAMLGSTTGSGSGFNAAEVTKLRADKAQLADENQILRTTIEFLFKKVGGSEETSKKL